MRWIQDDGPMGRLVGGMIRRAVRKQFKAVRWIPATVPEAPVIFLANHHGWYDGYLMYHLVSHLNLRSVDWIQEFDAFPLFAKVGGLPFRENDPTGRAKTIRQTIRLMREEQRSLILFGEGVLHYPPDVLPIGKSLELVARQVPNGQIVPVAICYEFAMHERAEAFLSLGSVTTVSDAHADLSSQVSKTRELIRTDPSRFEVLVKGTDSINERMDMRRFRKP